MPVPFCWIGRTDLRAAAGERATGLGPIGQAVEARQFSETHLLCDYDEKAGRDYVCWLKERTTARVVLHLVKLTSPVDFGEIYKNAVEAVGALVSERGKDTQLAFHTSPGTPAMAAVWILIAKTRHPAELIESSVEAGVKTVSIPFDISAEYIPDLLRRTDKKLQDLAQALPEEAPEFSSIVHRSPAMKSVA